MREAACTRHGREHWWRLRADSVRTPGEEPGAWVCALCHPVPEPLAPETERYVEEIHGLPTPTGAVGVPEPIAPESAEGVLMRWREEPEGWRKARVVQHARRSGEFHADMDEETLTGAVASLSKGGYLEKLNREGVIEKRGASYVWRLSSKGHIVASHLRRALGDTDRLPGPRREEAK